LLSGHDFVSVLVCLLFSMCWGWFIYGAGTVCNLHSCSLDFLFLGVVLGRMHATCCGQNTTLIFFLLHMAFYSMGTFRGFSTFGSRSAFAALTHPQDLLGPLLFLGLFFSKIPPLHSLSSPLSTSPRVSLYSLFTKKKFFFLPLKRCQGSKKIRQKREKSKRKKMK
jgi:hypothetical protein